MYPRQEALDPIKVLPEKESFFHNLRNRLEEAGHAVKYGTIWLYHEVHFWFHLFSYTSRRFVKAEAMLSVLGAIAFFGVVIVQDKAPNLHSFLEFSYLFFSVVMVLMAMNLLPRERDEETLEILWSQPMRRSSLIILQLFTLASWILLFSLISVLVFNLYTAYPEPIWQYILLVVTTAFTVGCITVLISTFTRHALATGLVTVLILGIHYYWLRVLGPLEIFYNPLPIPEITASTGRGDFGMGGGFNTRNSMFDLYFNRGILLVLVGFILDYLFRRLRRTAEWFT